MKPFTPFLIIALIAGTALAAPDDVTTLEAPDGTTVVIYRDLYGVPHIRAASEAGVFYGQGYAVAQDRLFQMEIFRRTALGTLSEVGVGDRQTDIQVRATTYTDAERVDQYARLRPETRSMIDSYVSGINAWLEVVASDPMTYRPAEFFAPSLAFSAEDPRAWTRGDVVAISQLIMRRFGQYGGEELFRHMELIAHGPEWFDENRPINDPDAPTSIHDGSAAKAGADARYNKSSALPDVDPAAVEALRSRDAAVEADLARIGVPPKLGSFGAIIAPAKSASGNVMLLGAPQLSPPMRGQSNLTHELELDAPSLHVAGMTVAGVPGVIIGHTEHVSWSLTSGNSDNTDTFVETLDENATAYWHNGDFHPLEVIPEPDLGIARLRTVHGPVIQFDPQNRRAYTWQMTFWDAELEMVEAFYNIWKATDLEEFESALRGVPMNFNVLYAGRDKLIKYFHVGRLLRSIQELGGPDPRLPRLGDGSQEWGEDPFLRFDELPQASQDAQDYFVNWNNKPVAWWNNGDNVPWAIAHTPERTLRVEKIESYLGPLPNVTFENLKDVPLQINDHGTYQQVVEFAPSHIRNENVIPPGQSGFISLSTGPDPHTSDQWELHENWAFKNMVFNERVRLWPPNNKFVDVSVSDYVDAGDPSAAYAETVWSDEGAAGESIRIPDCGLVQLRATRDGDGDGHVYTIHAAALDPVGKKGTAALFQVYVPKSASPQHSFAVDNGPALAIDGNCAAAAPHAQKAGERRARLRQNRPNPFNPSTRIEYDLPQSGHVVLSVYNVLGQEVRRLIDGVQDAGVHGVAFDGTGLSSGVYFYVLRQPGSVLTRSMILQK